MSNTQDLSLLGSTLTSDGNGADVTGSVTADGLTVGTSSDAYSAVYIISSITGESELRMGDTDTDAGSIAYTNSDDTMTFRAAAGARMTLDSTGIDVTGTVTADGLTVEASSALLQSATGTSSPTPTTFNISTTSSASDWSTTSPWGRLAFYSGDGSGGGGKPQVVLDATASNAIGASSSFSVSTTSESANTLTKRLNIAYNGDISFYEDTGTTPKFFWDASAESLGIGTDSPSRLAHLYGTSNPALRLDNGTNTVDIGIATSSGALLNGSSANDLVIARNGAYNIKFGTNGSTRAVIDSSGNVGIGVSNPLTKLHLDSPITNAQSANSSRSYKLLEGYGYTVGGNYYGQYAIGTSYNSAANTGTLEFFTGSGSSAPTEAMRIDASGNVNINGTDNRPLAITSFATASAGAGWDLDATSSNGVVTVSTGGTEAMRIDSSGNLLVGTAVSAAKLAVKTNGTVIQGFSVLGDTTGDTPYTIAQFGKYDNDSTTSQVFVNFVVNNGAVAQGQINANGSGAVAFGSWSDSRLKENITDLPNQLANITALRPVEFDYIESEGGGHQLGFIAQEVEEIYPDLVGERQDGMKTLSGMGKMEARLIKAIQEQQVIIEALTARIAALES